MSVVPSREQLAQAREDYLALLSKLSPGAARVTDKAPLNFMSLHMIHIALPQSADHPLPAESDPHLPLKLFYAVRRQDPLHVEQGTPSLIYYRQYARSDGALAFGTATRPLHRSAL